VKAKGRAQATRYFSAPIDLRRNSHWGDLHACLGLIAAVVCAIPAMAVVVSVAEMAVSVGLVAASVIGDAGVAANIATIATAAGATAARAHRVCGDGAEGQCAAMRSPVRDTLIDERMIPPLFSSSAAPVEQTVFVMRRLIDVGPRGNRCRACRKGRRLSHYSDSPERAAVAGKVFRETARGDKTDRLQLLCAFPLHNLERRDESKCWA
jgi:hypothetical protein